MSYTIVGALSSKFMSEYGIEKAQLGILFSVYSLPNIIAVFVAGLLIDIVGLHFVMLGCAAFCVVGNLITLGNNFWFMLVGRIIYGLGSECMGVVQSNLVARWFSFDKQIALSFATAASFLTFRISSFLMMFVFPTLADRMGLRFALFVVNIMIGLSALSCCLLVFIDKRYDKYLHMHDHEHEAKPNRLKALTQCVHLRYWFWLNVALCIFYYGAILSFVSFANLYIANKFGVTTTLASTIMSLLYGIPIILICPVGILVDRFGHRLTMLVFGVFSAWLALLLLTFTPLTPWVAACLFGITYSTVPAIIYPLFALV